MDDLQMFHDHKVSFVRFYNANQGLEHPQWSAGDGIFECSLMYYNQVAGSSSTTRFVFAWYDTTFRECCFSSEEKSLCNIVDPDDFTTTVVSEFPEYTEPGSKTVNAADQKDGPIMLWRPRDECPPAPLPTPAPTPAPTPTPTPAPTPAPARYIAVRESTTLAGYTGTINIMAIGGGGGGGAGHEGGGGSGYLRFWLNNGRVDGATITITIGKGGQGAPTAGYGCEGAFGGSAGTKTVVSWNGPTAKTLTANPGRGGQETQQCNQVTNHGGSGGGGFGNAGYGGKGGENGGNGESGRGTWNSPSYAGGNGQGTWDFSPLGNWNVYSFSYGVGGNPSSGSHQGGGGGGGVVANTPSVGGGAIDLPDLGQAASALNGMAGQGYGAGGGGGGYNQEPNNPTKWMHHGGTAGRDGLVFIWFT